jgi:hypothetical protein
MIPIRYSHARTKPLALDLASGNGRYRHITVTPGRAVMLIQYPTQWRKAAP